MLTQARCCSTKTILISGFRHPLPTMASKQQEVGLGCNQHLGAELLQAGIGYSCHFFLIQAHAVSTCHYLLARNSVGGLTSGQSAT